MTEEQRIQKIAEIRKAIEILRKADEMRKEAFRLIGKDSNNMYALEFRDRHWLDGTHEMVQLYTGIDEFAEIVQSNSMRDENEKYVDFDGVRFLQVMWCGGKK